MLRGRRVLGADGPAPLVALAVALAGWLLRALPALDPRLEDLEADEAPWERGAAPGHRRASRRGRRAPVA